MRLTPILVLAALAACQSTPAPRAPANLEQLLNYCQQKAALNFTYTAETGTRLREHGFRLEGSDPCTAESWLAVLRGVLAPQELELVRIGPEHLEVWLVRPVPKRA